MAENPEVVNQESQTKHAAKRKRMNTEVTASRIYCTYTGCQYSCVHQSKLIIHMRIHSGDKPYLCIFEGCSKRFAQSGNLTKHVRVHDGNKPYLCTFEGCGKRFAQSGNLTTHVRIHDGNKPYLCTFEGCSKRFAQSSVHTKHVRVHDGNKPYLCTFQGCSKRFPDSSDLTKHVRIHDGNKPYLCTFEGCSKRFAQSGHLTSHVRVHDGNKPYLCTFEGCSKRFAQSSNLTSHVRVHDGNKPYLCTFEGCGKRFTESGHLTKHVRLHTKDTPYMCHFVDCALVFKQSSNLTSHLKRRHAGDGGSQKYVKLAEEWALSFLRSHGIEPDRELYVSFTGISDEQQFARVDFVFMYRGVMFVLEIDEHCHGLRISTLVTDSDFENNLTPNVSDEKYNNDDSGCSDDSDEIQLHSDCDRCPQGTSGNRWGYEVKCEQRRMLDCIARFRLDGNVAPILIIRCNPDAYTVDGNPQHLLRKDRELLLWQLISKYEPVSECAVQYAFYDMQIIGDHKRCVLWNHKDFNPEVEKMCLPPI
jgi:hypothetical protein